MTDKTAYTAAQIRAALKAHFPHPDYGLVFEVARSTGHAARRHLDAVAMDLWPSRGLELHGIEIKVSRSDLAAELKNPSKSDEIAQFCNRFWLATPIDLVKEAAELPLAWGLLVFDGKDIIPKKKAHAHPGPRDPTREFLAAIFRAAGRPIDPEMFEAAITREKDRLRKANAEHLEGLIKNRREPREVTDAENWRKFLAAVGETSWSPELDKVIDKYRSAKALTDARGSIKSAINHVDHAANTLKKTAESIGGTE